MIIFSKVNHNFPSQVSKILNNAFDYCKNLRKFEIPPNIQTIESNLFSDTKIEKIFIPSKISKICEFAFHSCYSLTKVEIPSNSNLQIIESSAFSRTNIEKIIIKVNLIESFCFIKSTI